MRRYLDAAGGTKHMHYYLQLSEGDPKTDPITLCKPRLAACRQQAYHSREPSTATNQSTLDRRDERRSRMHEPQRWL